MNLSAILRHTGFRRATPNDRKSLNVQSAKQVRDLTFTGTENDL